MEWKDALIPKPVTSLVFVVLFAGTQWLFQHASFGGPWKTGFPFVYYINEWLPTGPVPIDPLMIQPGYFVSYGALLLDMLIILAISYAIVTLYYLLKFRKN